MKIGRTIKLLRTAAGTKQSVLADAVGVSPSYLSLIESDQREPSLTLLKAVSRTLNVPVSVLVFDATEAPEELPPAQKEEFRRMQELTIDVMRRAMLIGK